MEAASARMAARERYGVWAEPAHTPLQRMILNACDPQNFEPNLALNLEIADMINAKKGNAPREAAIAIVNYVNHRNPNVSLLALNLLDICVKNCGYPFHLQISTKEFLNELVRRFPERPPVHPTRSQMKILELIEEWRSTICQTSRYKEDLGFIRDMHRLLSYKGYVFPEVRKEDAAVLNPSDNLRSAEEMEEEERAAQSAKLQELIRRGGPHDLQEANKLMKVMAGYDTRNKTDWRAKAAEEVAKVQQKAKLLEENLQNYKQGDQIKDGDVFEDLANALMSAQPKIQKMCEEESDDHEAVAKLLEINDSIHRTIERYKLIKKGDVDGANKIPKGTLGTSGAGVSRGANNELSLIDLGGPEDNEASQSASSASAPVTASNALEDDLLGLSIGDSYGQGGTITLGTSNGIAASASLPPSGSQSRHLTNTQITSLFNQPQQPVSARPGSGSFGALNFSAPPTSSPVPQSAAFSPPPTQQQPAQAPRADPFASLASASQSSRTTSPFQFQQSTHPPSQPQSANLLGLNSSAPPSQQPSRPISQGSAPADDEWTFSSALPDSSSELTITNSSILVLWSISRSTSDPSLIEIHSRISNNTPNQITELTFSTAVTRSLQLKLEPQSSRALKPNQQSGITQTIKLMGVEQGRGTTVRIRWKASYMVEGIGRKEEMGEVQGLGIP